MNGSVYVVCGYQKGRRKKEKCHVELFNASSFINTNVFLAYENYILSTNLDSPCYLLQENRRYINLFIYYSFSLQFCFLMNYWQGIGFWTGCLYLGSSRSDSLQRNVLANPLLLAKTRDFFSIFPTHFEDI